MVKPNPSRSAGAEVYFSQSPAQRRRSWRLPRCTCRTQGFGCTGAASLSWTSSFLALFVLEDPYSSKPCLGSSLNCCWVFLGEDKPRSVLPSFLTLFLCIRASVYGETVFVYEELYFTFFSYKCMNSLWGQRVKHSRNKYLLRQTIHHNTFPFFLLSSEFFFFFHMVVHYQETRLNCRVLSRFFQLGM